jgi:methylmalonyl-CoA mutase N-terminal domain/subunit
MAGIFGGLQSLHTDSYDEALSTPTEEAARIALNTQNILHEEAHLDQVIDPLAGSYYLETLTNQMEEEIMGIIRVIDEAGGMYAAAEGGLVQEMIGRSALQFQNRIESGEEKIVGVNAYRQEDEHISHQPLPRPDLTVSKAQAARLRAYKAARDKKALREAVHRLARACQDPGVNLFGEMIAATEAGATHGEIVACLRGELGFGHPKIVA